MLFKPPLYLLMIQKITIKLWNVEHAVSGTACLGQVDDPGCRHEAEIVASEIITENIFFLLCLFCSFMDDYIRGYGIFFKRSNACNITS